LTNTNIRKREEDKSRHFGSVVLDSKRASIINGIVIDSSPITGKRKIVSTDGEYKKCGNMRPINFRIFYTRLYA